MLHSWAVAEPRLESGVGPRRRRRREVLTGTGEEGVGRERGRGRGEGIVSAEEGGLRWSLSAGSLGNGAPVLSHYRSNLSLSWGNLLVSLHSTVSFSQCSGVLRPAGHFQLSLYFPALSWKTMGS